MKKRPTKKPRTLLIDGDIVLYQQAWANQKKIVWDADAGIESTVLNPEKAKAAAHDYIEWLRKLFWASEVLVMVTGGENWRRKLHPAYKANRTGPKPELLGVLVEYLDEHFTVISEPALEADDLLGIYMTDKKLIKGERIICSIDKDLRTIPGLLYNPKHKGDGVVKTTEEEAQQWFFQQVLMGDPIDGYYGVPKIGKVKSQRIIEEAVAEGRDLWETVLHCYLSAGLTEADALRTAQLAYILQAGDYNFETKEVSLWNPKRIRTV